MIRILYPRESDIAGALLICHPNVIDIDICKSVIMVIGDSDDGGYIGLKINHPLKSVKSKFGGLPVYSGGPTAKKNMIMIHSSDVFLSNTKKVTSDIFITAIEKDNRELLGKSLPSENFIVSGCVQWKRNELECEIANGIWFTHSLASAHHNLIFNMPIGDRWYSAFNRAKIDVSYICTADQIKC